MKRSEQGNPKANPIFFRQAYKAWTAPTPTSYDGEAKAQTELGCHIPVDELRFL